MINLECLASWATPVTLHQRDPTADTSNDRSRSIGGPRLALLIQHPTSGWGIMTPP